MAGISGTGISGLASGMDWQSYINEMVTAEQAGESSYKTRQTTLQNQYQAWTAIKTALNTLQDKLKVLQAPSLFENSTATVSDSTKATATTASGASTGTYTFKVTQLATAGSYNGASNVGKPLSASSDVSGVTLATAGFATAVTAGTFTVNNEQITIATTDTLQSVFDKIASATNNAVTASYDADTDEITLQSSDPITLGSANDTSNFFTATKLANNSSNSITSSSALGCVPLTATLSNTNLQTPITADSSGKGSFTINGVTISYSLTSDSIQNVLDSINNSDAGVTASYDSQNDRFVLTNKSTGDLGISLKDVTGNFLAATGLGGGSLAHGQNLLYTVNGGTQISSISNTITSDTSGITGLSVTALAASSTDSFTITVASDTSKVKTAISDLVDAYNTAQQQISSYTISTTDSSGNVTSGTLSQDHDATDLANSLRSQIFGQIGALSSTMNQMADLGYQTSGYSNTLTLQSSDTLDKALSKNLTDVKLFFSDSASGLAVTFGKYLNTYNGDDGTLATHQKNISKSSADITVQINNMEKRIQDDKTRMTNEFVAMEQAQSKLNNEMSYIKSIG